MKKIIALVLLVVGTNVFATDWWPGSSSGLQIKKIGLDLSGEGLVYPANTNANIYFKFIESPSKTYYHFYDSTNPASLAKANQLLSILMTAKSNGEGAYVGYYTSVGGGSNNPICPANYTCFKALQLGND